MIDMHTTHLSLINTIDDAAAGKRRPNKPFYSLPAVVFRTFIRATVRYPHLQSLPLFFSLFSRYPT